MSEYFTPQSQISWALCLSPGFISGYDFQPFHQGQCTAVRELTG